MSEVIDVSKLSPQQVAKLLKHVFEREAASTARNNRLVLAVEEAAQLAVEWMADFIPKHPGDAEAVAAGTMGYLNLILTVLNDWSTDQNLIGESSNVEIERIVSGAPAKTAAPDGTPLH